LGRHGLRYARHLLDPPLPKARLVAVCRRDAVLGQAFATSHSLRFYHKYQDLIADPAVQAVVVVTPPSLTHPICLEAVRARKPLLIEKPLAPTGSVAQAIVEAAASADVPLMTAQTMRYDAAVRALKAELASVGPRRYLVLTNRVEPRPEVVQDPSDYAGRGILLEIGVHQLDLVRYLTGEEVSEVRCDMDSDGPGQPESRALVRLRTVGGLPCIIDVSRVTEGRVGRAEWVGRDGQIAADWVRHRICRTTGRMTMEERPVEDRPTLVDVLQDFVEALDQGKPMPITGLDGQRAVELADACYRSAVTGEAIRLDVP
jgi:predicted dehydrogenase